MVTWRRSASTRSSGAASTSSPRGSELLATPQAECGPGSRPELGIQGRVSREEHDSGRAAEGYQCNVEMVGSYRPTVTTDDTFGSIAGFKTLRYVDDQGNECAYYDTTLLFPTNVVDAQGGVNVLDMSDPTTPKVTATLRTPGVSQPHESLVLSEQRGLLAAVTGTLSTSIGILDLYDISQDCRTPTLFSTTPFGVLGHESGLSPDGMTFYSASTATDFVFAVDISDPLIPQVIWTGTYGSHGLSISEDGTRGYLANSGEGLIIIDTTEIQERVTNPNVPEIGRLDWTSRSIPQNAIPFTRDGHAYVMEIDEFGAQSEVGAARIIDIEDETNPFVVSNLRLAVNQPENFAAQAGDPGAIIPIQGYAGHYCGIPTRVDPTIVACSFILSGLRVFDITDVANPVEIAYFNAPIQPRPGFDDFGVFEPSNWAMSQPTFVPERNEIWYTDAFQGFFAVRLTNDMWPTDEPAPAPEPTATATAAPEPTATATAAPQLPTTGGSSWSATAALALLGGVLLRRRFSPQEG